MKRVAAVDLGTNSTRLLVADVAGEEVHEVERILRITRLGEGVDERRRLLPVPIARVRNVLVDYRRVADELGAERTLAFATSAVRDADNGEAFLGEIEWSYGFTTRLLTGDEEALLTFRGVASGGELSARTLVVDVGGGSTELVLGCRAGIEFRASLDLGCVRLTERFLHGDPPSPDELERCADHVRSVLARRVGPLDVEAAIGVAGTVTTLATLDLGLEEEIPDVVHGHRMTTAWIGRELERLAGMTVAELRVRPGIQNDRAPVLVAGVVVALEVLRHFGLAELEASERDILHGVALVAAELPDAVVGDAPPRAYTCC
jgi:exopolyphosphatase / guanosine-5'-triphosphate,3'-diphosphate pyrophosphatase